ncbi:unnamed protein product [Ilex paraguariensis]|uniref:PI4-kinase N-terminal domain-containing protein n=1 Tax=Ilex paraguariensis TaxID=185542 RepID=A0ABC8RS65_9AQUA
MAVAESTGEIVMSAINNAGGDLGVFLLQNFHPILLSNASRLVSTLLDRFEISVPSSPRELVLITPEASSPQCSPLGANHYQSNERNSPGNEVSNASGSSSGDPSRVTDEATSALWSKGLVMKGGSLAWKSNVYIFGADVGFNDEGRGGPSQFAKEQLQSLLAFLKIWKRDWTELGQLLKVRINTELSVYQAAAGLQIKSLSSVDLNGKSSKRLCIVDRSC